jgi:hypothetical protein
MDSIVKSAMFSLPLPEPEFGVDSDHDHDHDDPDSTPAEPKTKKRKVTVDRKPVIRIVFALASPEPAVVFKKRPEKMHHFDGFTAFDIWLAGLSNETFRQIEDGDLVHYRTLLERSLTPHDAFELTDVADIGQEAKKSRGARRRKMAPLTFPEHAHHSIHQMKDLENPGEGSERQPGVGIPARVQYNTPTQPNQTKNPRRR